MEIKTRLKLQNSMKGKISCWYTLSLFPKLMYKVSFTTFMLDYAIITILKNEQDMLF